MGRTLKQAGLLRNKGLAKAANVTNRMNPALQSKAEELDAQLGDAVNQTFVFKHLVGTTFVEIRKHPEIYGANGVDLLRDYLKLKQKDVTQTIRLVNKYDLPELMDIANRHTQLPKAQGRINWAHMDNLLRDCLTPDDVKHLVDLTVNRGWTAPELSKYIKENYSGDNARGGRNLDASSKGKLIGRFVKDFEELQNHYMKLWVDVTNPASNSLTHNLDDLTEDALTGLTKLIGLLDTAEDTIADIRETINTTGVVKLWTDYLRERTNSEGNTPEEQALKDAEENSVELAMGDGGEDDEPEEEPEEDVSEEDDAVDDLVARAMAD